MNKGTLYFVGVPIGNYNDITLRALDVLKKADLILCEDTRETIKLLDNFILKKETISYIGSFSFTYKKTVEYLKNNKSVAFVSDRGMPSISDPGAEFLTYFRNIKANIKIIPGVSSVTTAFSLSGNSGNFYFYGFMPRKTNDIIKIVEELLPLKTNLIFFESPYRINKTLEILSKILGDKPIKICRELTKIYEELIEGTCEELKNREIKGEIILII